MRGTRCFAIPSSGIPITLDAVSRHPESADLGVLGVDPRLDRLEGDVWREAEELKGEELLRPLLRGVRLLERWIPEGSGSVGLSLAT